MLLRTYRLTDRLGLVFLKLTTGAVAQSLERTGTIVQSGNAFVIGVLRLGWAALVVLLTVIRVVLRRLATVLVWLYQQVRRLVVLLVGGLGIVGQTGARLTQGTAKTVRQAASGVAEDTMARRKARAEMEVGLAEDPLKSQNRMLSGLVVVVLVLLIGVVIWATSQPGSSTSTAAPIRQPGITVNDDDTVPSAATPVTDPVESVLNIPTAIPTATEIPSVLRAGGTLAYTVRERGQTDIWAVPVGSRVPLRVTNSPEDDRDPAWSPDGQRLAYASRQEDDNWDIYIYDLASGGTSRMTFNLAFEANPDWSPDGQFLVYESYTREAHLDIYVMPSDGSAVPQPLPGDGNSTEPDFAPTWSPNDGRQIAFVSTRTGNKDIFVFDLNTQTVRNLTNTPTRDEDHPAWSPDGDYLAYSAVEAGAEKVFVQAVNQDGAEPTVFRQGREPAWAPDGTSIVFAADSTTNTFLTVAPFVEGGVTTEVIQVPRGVTGPVWTSAALPLALINSGGLPSSVETVLFEERYPPASGDPPYQLDTIINVEGPDLPVLNERVNDSFNALRVAVNDASGRDFLGELTDAFRPIEQRPQPGEPVRDWHKTGRAISFNPNQGGFPPVYEVVMQDDGLVTTWRVFLRVADEAQNGQFGEPLRDLPWDFSARDSGDVQAYNQGGRYRASVPDGYYIDLTQIAEDYGWQRMPAGSDWRSNFVVRNYWMLYKPEGLTWLEAMRELYTEPQLGGFVPTATPPPVPTEDATETP